MRSADPDKEVPAEVPLGALAVARVTTCTTAGSDTTRDDAVAVEAPLEMRIGGKPVTVLMRTPGHDEELVTGFLFGEGVIADADDVIAIEHALSAPYGPQRTDGEAAPYGPQVEERPRTDGGENVIDVRLMVSRRPIESDRLFFSNSSCGICGKRSLAAVEVRGTEAQTTFTVPRAVLAELPKRLRAAQPTFARTGGVHASGLFTPGGELVAVREDVGRHNALDKLVGWALNEGRVPLSEFVLLVSGRVSYELVQKAVAAGVPFVAAVGAPSSLAVELAERFGITLVGFLREGGMNVYAHPGRVG